MNRRFDARSNGIGVETLQQVKGSMMFNDDFLEEEYTNLPHYDGTEMLPVRRGTASLNCVCVCASFRVNYYFCRVNEKAIQHGV